MITTEEMRTRLEAIRARVRRSAEVRSEAYARAKVLGTAGPMMPANAVRSSGPTLNFVAIRVK